MCGVFREADDATEGDRVSASYEAIRKQWPGDWLHLSPV